MPETTNPQPGVAQEALDPVSRMANVLTQSEDQAQDVGAEQGAETSQPEAKPAEQPNDQAELSPEDLEGEVEQSAVDAFEIVHQGQQVKLTREEAIKYAQQGLDYTRKAQAVAEKDRLIAQQLQRLAEVDQVRPYLQQQEQIVNTFAAQLQPYQQVNWVQLAKEDPLGYPAVRAQFDSLREQYQRAVGEYNHARGAVTQQLQSVWQQRLQQEEARLPEFVPEWRDAKKFESAKADMAKHYETTYGLTRDVLNAKLDSAEAMAIAYKAMKYDQLVRAKSEKTNLLRQKPPVTVPGAAQSGAARTDQQRQLQQKLKKTGSAEDAMAVLLNRMK
jgi:hypothetical protein